MKALVVSVILIVAVTGWTLWLVILMAYGHAETPAPSIAGLAAAPTASLPAGPTATPQIVNVPLPTTESRQFFRSVPEPTVMPTAAAATKEAPAPSAAPAPAPRPGCDPAYPEERTCIPPGPPFNQGCVITDQRLFKVLEPDPQRLDSDNDGIGCEPIASS